MGYNGKQDRERFFREDWPVVKEFIVEAAATAEMSGRSATEVEMSLIMLMLSRIIQDDLEEIASLKGDEKPPEPTAAAWPFPTGHRGGM